MAANTMSPSAARSFPVQSAPALVELYAHKPLPPLPLKLQAKKRMATRTTAQKSWEARSGVAELDESSWSASVTPRSQGRRRSSYKIQQLTGYDVFVTDDCSVASDSSSEYSQQWEEDWFSLLPLLEAVGGDSPSSRGSSSWWAPASSSSSPSSSPPCPSPLRIRRRAVRQGSDISLDGHHRSSPGSRLAMDEEPVSRWDPAYGQFTDSKAAGAYHRIATELAAAQHPHRPERVRSQADAAAGTWWLRQRQRQRPSSGAGLVINGAAAAFLPRRRTTSQPITVTPSSAPKRRRRPKQLKADGDSSDDLADNDVHVRQGPSWTGDQVKELSQHAKYRTRIRNHTPSPSPSPSPLPSSAREERWRRHMRRKPL